ncbi:MAG TPA: TetR family transcriptional regulator [Spirochaetia bacterium]|nr:TetR family transcriptional regulator [Spirochaetia bacterium]
MSNISPAPKAPGGLRERKKAKSRALIQQQALRLFTEKGYDATTVEQIAEAAEVSPSTFFRYFPTKEDVVLYDSLDPILLEGMRTQPPELSPIQAMRATYRSVFSQLPPGERDMMWQRSLLIRSAPELRARMLEDLVKTIETIGEIVAGRVGRPADDFGVRAFSGAVMGAALAAWLTSEDMRPEKAFQLIDDALAFLEAGLPL